MYKFWQLWRTPAEQAGGSFSGLICAEGLVLVTSSATLSIAKWKAAPQLCDVVTLMWGRFSAYAEPPGSE